MRDQIDVEEAKIIKDLNYCIKMISSNQLYEAKLEIDPDQGESKENQNIMMLMNEYSKMPDRDNHNRQLISHQEKL